MTWVAPGETVVSDEECPHGLDSRWCSICLHGVSKPPEQPTVEATFAARFDGYCSPCNLPISAGQVISKLSDGRYVHKECI